MDRGQRGEYTRFQVQYHLSPGFIRMTISNSSSRSWIPRESLPSFFLYLLSSILEPYSFCYPIYILFLLSCISGITTLYSSVLPEYLHPTLLNTRSTPGIQESTPVYPNYSPIYPEYIRATLLYTRSISALLSCIPGIYPSYSPVYPEYLRHTLLYTRSISELLSCIPGVYSNQTLLYTRSSFVPVSVFPQSSPRVYPDS